MVGIPVYVETDDCILEEICEECLTKAPEIGTLCIDCLFTLPEGERPDQDFGSDMNF